MVAKTVFDSKQKKYVRKRVFPVVFIERCTCFIEKMRIPVLVQETCCQNLNARNTGIQKFCTGIENTNRNTHLLIFGVLKT